jgi:chemotaxis protein MotB
MIRSWPRRQRSEAAKAEVAKQDNRKLALLQRQNQFGDLQQPQTGRIQAQIRLEITPDGLQIQIVDDQNRADVRRRQCAGQTLHARHPARDRQRTQWRREQDQPGRAHRPLSPYGSGERGYSNWELSSDRANSSRRELVAAGMPDDKLARVTGMASSSLLEPQNP